MSCKLQYPCDCPPGLRLRLALSASCACGYLLLTVMMSSRVPAAAVSWVAIDFPPHSHQLGGWSAAF